MLMLQWKCSEVLLFLYLDLFHLKMDKMHAKDTVDIRLCERVQRSGMLVWKKTKINFFLLLNWVQKGNLEKLRFKTIQCYSEIIQLENVECIYFLRKHIPFLHSLSSRCSILEQQEQTKILKNPGAVLWVLWMAPSLTSIKQAEAQNAGCVLVLCLRGSFNL